MKILNSTLKITTSLVIGVIGLILCFSSSLLAQNTTLIATGATWKYLDNGSNQGTAWRGTGFNDASWSSGAAQLGFGDGDESTIITSGYVTYYFRHSITVADPNAYTDLILDIMRDDGAVVYINGTEVYRTNMPSGTISYTTTASSAVGGASESTYYQTTVSAATYLQAGTNVIAVEIHQSSAGSSDVSFNLKLEATPASSPSNYLIQSGATWKYLDNGTNQGTAWRDSSFNDASWASGDAELGYGDGDETTIVSYGPSSSNKYVTTYFRKSFNIADINAINALNLRMIRDDGIVVYVNGVEVFRNNLPTGTISYTTLASSAIGGSDESTWLETSPSTSYFVTGNNVIAVEMHQNSVTSSDLSFDLELIKTDPGVTRGPYLQMAASDRMTVRWRTNVATISTVKYGTSESSLTSTVTDATVTTEHIVDITGLSADTKYFYSLGYDTTTLAGGDTTYFFKTTPAIGTRKPFRAWVLGDAGTADNNQRAVRDAYYSYTGNTHTDMVMLLGDNAYTNGTDNEYQGAVFEDMYEEMLRKSTTWSCPGNHEFGNGSTSSSSQTGPYYDIFTFPKAGECGGLASGTEAYYSYDFANVHFISMDSHDSPRGSTDPMLTWLQNDLAATTQEWIIAYWHHPPYTKGSHNSDTESNLIDMRQNALPILEAAGVDLVLSGHSHSYERSYLLNGHYGLSSTFNSSTHAVDYTSGNITTDCAYDKVTTGSDAGKGAVYITSGSAGKISGGSLNHPAMYLSLNQLGSVVLDIDSNRMDVRFITSTGAVNDYFTLFKDNNVKLDTTIANGQSVTLTAGWTGSYSWSPGGQTTQSINVSPGSTTTYLVEDPGGCNRNVFTVTVAEGNLKPTAIDDNATTNKNVAKAISVLANDMDPDGSLNPATVSVISGPTNGSTSVNTSTGVITYTPNTNFTGYDQFQYQVGDNGVPAPVLYDTALVTVRIKKGRVTTPYNYIEGKVFLDANLNNTFDGMDYGQGAIEVIATDEAAPVSRSMTSTPGTYSVLSDPDGDYTLSVPGPGYGEVEVRVNASGEDALEASVSGAVSITGTTLSFPDDASVGASGTVFIAQGATWKYLDNGSNQGTAWRDVSFNDASWSSGPAILGYGGNGEVTTVSYGPSSSNKYVTTYLRYSFAVADPNVYNTLTLSVLRDDGIVVYLNGTEIDRQNMPSGSVSYTTLASSAVGGADESTYYQTTIAPSFLQTGTNVLAVELHQVNVTSSDLSFDLEFSGSIGSTVIATGSIWKYLDNGSNAGTAWRAPNFNDASWASGPAKLGYGEGDESTTVSYGSNSADKYITTYFRNTFNIADPSAIDYLELNLLRDDGAIVYINGEEVFRSNMPEGECTYLTNSSTIVSGGNESTYFTGTVSANVLVAGTNVIAVEIHQRDSSSSDLGFDLSLTTKPASNQLAGLKFSNVAVPQGVTIREAYITFTSKNDGTSQTNMVIKAHDVDNAPGFSTTANDLSSRSLTSDSVQWYYVQTWADSVEYESPDLSNVVQEIIDRSGWASGNGMAFIISGSGIREAWSFDSNPDLAPALTIKYYDGSITETLYNISIDSSDLSSDFRWSTDNLETATFTDTNQTDVGNNFGYIGSSSMCYAVGDGENDIMDGSYHIINRFSGKNKKMGDLDINDLEALAANETNDTVFAANYATIGFLDIMTGSFTPIGGPASTANGSAGSITLNDYDGLSFDFTTNTLFAANRRTSANDILLKIDRNTGSFIPNAFGAGVDYVVISGTGVLGDVDDIAVDPGTGVMYAVNNNGGAITQIISINKTTGASSVISSLGVSDMEGQGFANDGNFYATTGKSSTAGLNDIFWQIDISTGDTTRIAKFDEGSDFESCDCLTASPLNLVFGTVFEDADSNGTMDAGEAGYSNTTIYIYRDNNLNGIIDGGDVLIDSAVTNANGDYSFLISEKNSFVLTLNVLNLPLNAIMTTDSLEDATFNALGIADGQNNFGFNIPPGNPLPVALLYFTAQLNESQVWLDWATSMEVNNDYFNIEKSVTGAEFNKIGKVKGVGNSINKNTYKFIDETPEWGLNYYRLKQVDEDGKFTYSKVAKVMYSPYTSLTMSVSPNPANDLTSIYILSDKEEYLTIELLNMSGVVLYSENIFAPNGIAQVDIDLTDFSSGFYLVRISNEHALVGIKRLMKTQ